MKKSPSLFSLIDKACFDYNLIEENDRILIGASGGKDSTSLIHYFSQRKKRPSANFEFKALNIQSDFAPPFPEGIKNLFDEWNVPFESININILERIKAGEKMNCWWCSTQRRTELISYAKNNGYNKIALGHHMDDILETFLMNLTQKCELSAMNPRLEYQNFPVTIIRPLCYVSENQLVDYASKTGFELFTCTCNYQNNSSRKAARKQLEQLTGSDEKMKERMFKALQNVKTDYLP